MIFFLVYMMVFFGIVMAGIVGLLPLQQQFAIPDWLRFGMFFIGLVITFVGISLVHSRASKTGAGHILEFGRPGNLIWFYVYRDGTVKITPSIREVEGQLYSKELDAQIHDFKSYKLFDHSIRFVPEGIGHSVDLDLCLYTGLLKTKWGFASLREARENGFKGLFKGRKEIPSKEYIARPQELG